jgi:hypothetical protein
MQHDASSQLKLESMNDGPHFSSTTSLPMPTSWPSKPKLNPPIPPCTLDRIPAGLSQQNAASPNLPPPLLSPLSALSTSNALVQPHSPSASAYAASTNTSPGTLPPNAATAKDTATTLSYARQTNQNMLSVPKTTSPRTTPARSPPVAQAVHAPTLPSNAPTMRHLTNPMTHYALYVSSI